MTFIGVDRTISDNLASILSFIIAVRSTLLRYPDMTAGCGDLSPIRHGLTGQGVLDTPTMSGMNSLDVLGKNIYLELHAIS